MSFCHIHGAQIKTLEPPIFFISSLYIVENEMKITIYFFTRIHLNLFNTK